MYEPHFVSSINSELTISRMFFFRVFCTEIDGKGKLRKYRFGLQKLVKI
eukprot:UN20809